MTAQVCLRLSRLSVRSEPTVRMAVLHLALVPVCTWLCHVLGSKRVVEGGLQRTRGLLELLNVALLLFHLALIVLTLE